MPDAVSDYLKAIGRAPKRPDFSDVTSSSSTRTPKKREVMTGDAVTDYMIVSGREFPKEAKKESRGIRAGLETAVGAVRNPGQAIKGMAAAVKQDYRAATNKKIIGGFESDIIGYDQAGDPIRKPMSKASIVSKDTPGAQTMKDWGKGARNTVMNAAFAVAPTQGLLARSLLNAGAGAVQDDEDRLRGATAGLLLGETLHQGIKAPGRVGRGILGKLDVSEGVVAEGASGVKESGQEAVLWGPNRRPRETLPANQQPPVEPKPDATTFSTKGTARRRIAAKAATANDPIDFDPGEGWAMRPGTEKSPVWERVATEPEPLIAKELEPPKETAVATREGAETVSFPPEPDIAPVVSANGEFQARPGVIRAVNRELEGKGPTTTTPLPRIKPEDIADVTPRISVDEANRRIEVAVEAQKAQQKANQEKRIVGQKAGELFDESRMPSGKLRPFHTVSTEALLREANALEAKRAAAELRSVYNFTPDDNFHSTDDGRSVMNATRKNGQVSVQAKALQNLSDFERIQKQLDAELTKRGIRPEDVYAKQRELAEADAAYEREGQAHAGDELDRELYGEPDQPKATPAGVTQDAHDLDTSFDFGENVDAPNPVTQPREYLNYAKFGLDQTTEARVRAAVEAGRASGTMDKGRKSFDIQNEEARAFAKQMVANPLDLDNTKLKGLTGAQIVGLHEVVGENTRVAEAASRTMNSGELSAAEFADAQAVFDRAMKSTNEALTTIVREKAETARGLGFFRQVARQSTDPDVWLVHAKKMLGDKPLPDALMLEIRKLANEAAAACQ